jgi:hypothetical protein
MMESLLGYCARSGIYSTIINFDEVTPTGFDELITHDDQCASFYLAIVFNSLFLVELFNF